MIELWPERGISFLEYSESVIIEWIKKIIGGVLDEGQRKFKECYL
jgi:hypothetical protein